MRKFLLFACLAGLAGCGRTTDSLSAVENFDVGRYAGKWYEIARLPHSFERDLVGVTATYTIETNGTVLVENRGYNTRRKEWSSAQGRAHFKEAKNKGLLKVTFFWPFYGLYKVIKLDSESYGDAVVTSGTFDYLWILSRAPVLEPARLDSLMQFIAKSGFDTSELIMVDQSMNARKPE